MGSFHSLPVELQRTAIMTARENAKSNKQNFDKDLTKQFEQRRVKGEIKLDKAYDDAKGEFIFAIYFHKQFLLPWCWRSKEIANEVYLGLRSKTARLAAAKEQILMRTWGWVGRGHIMCGLRMVILSLQKKY